jgi:hypothetical protein
MRAKKIENDFFMYSTYLKGDTISTVGIDGDFLSGFNIPGANEYLLALKILIALFVILIVVWKLHLLSISRY